MTRMFISLGYRYVLILFLVHADQKHDDLVSLGKLIMTLCCEWFVPGQHPAAPLDHISRHYSPDVKNLVMYLCGKPPGPQGKNIDEVVSILGLRILNEFDAMQK
jgi:PAB-dependent poly(A)-specific ribonuclease subunit 3